MLIVLTINKVLISQVYDGNAYGLCKKSYTDQERAHQEEKEFQKLMRDAIDVLEKELRKLRNASTPEEAAKRLRYIATVATNRAKHAEKYLN